MEEGRGEEVKNITYLQLSWAEAYSNHEESSLAISSICEHTHIHTHTHIYIYIYIYRERERERDYIYR